MDCVQPFRDLDGNLTAYCVSFNNTDRAAGFLFLSLLVNGDPVVALGFDGHGPNDQVKESNGLLTAQSSENDFIYTGPGGLYKRENAQELTSLLSGENVSASEVEDEYRNYLESAHSSNRSVFASNGTIGGVIDWPAENVRASSAYKISEFGAGTDYWLMNDLSAGDNICAPAAAINIIWYWAFGRKYSNASRPVKGITDRAAKARSIYNRVASGMGVTSLGTWDTNVPKGYANYFEKSSDWGYRELPKSSGYGEFVSTLSSNIPIHLQVRMNNNPFTSEGHDMFTLGYAPSTTGSRYLWVMTGWYTMVGW